MEWYLMALRKYAQFSGRSHRREFWFYVLVNLIILSVIMLVGAILHLVFLGVIVARVYGLAVLVPNIAVTARRLHDTGRSGWWQLIYFVPVVGVIVMLVFLCQDSDPAENEYGPNPKSGGPAVTVTG
jgi:uncharacterized membrane protein YhaH (DUF805 family)